MFRINHLLKLKNTTFKFFTRSPLETSKILAVQRIQLYPQARFYSKDGDDIDKKVEDIKDKACQSKKPKKEHPKLVLKECKPIDIHPCRPPPPDACSRLPSLEETCPKPTSQSECPQSKPEPPPECPHDETSKWDNYKNAAWIGLLITAATLGALYALGFFNKKEKKEILAVRKKVKRVPVKDPKNSKDIPNDVPYLLIGGGTASFAAFRAIKSADPTAKRIAYLEDGYEIHYNKCLIATGANPKMLNVFEVACADPQIDQRVKIFRNIFDFEDVYDAFEESKSVAIIGGGFLGSELACALARKGRKRQKEVYQIFREQGNMGKILPEYLSTWTTNKVKAEGVNVLNNTEVIGVKFENEGLHLILSNGKSIRVDHAVIAVGVEPNTELAEKSNLEVDPELGGFLVNTELMARSHLYAAGDCACFYDAKLGRRRIEHHDHAVVTGRLAGENMTGQANPYLHQSMFWSDLGPDVGYEAIGIVDASLPTVGVFAKATDKDNPKAVVTETGEGIRSTTEAAEQKNEGDCKITKKDNLADNYGKGIVFYLRDDIVVGIVLWNVFNRMSIARQVLKDESKYDDLNEVAKLFNIHED
ncbi:apoptosis-inducing factor 1, mitochondrial [Asbolus verrucosus]|uniref:Apoptosis-inducing factor 1, mitochondrial n=1 Tax=Asbolus verrucosus TaxID=1661398 RepID=A0A482V6P2_ASBVE|nr:apoptosis-inducing factor 1, mitochondrial [Asbolus verrucosus]